MPRRISKLTACQLASLPGIRDEWLAHGLSTEPANRQAAEAGIRAAYTAGGLAPPRVIIWLGSPWTGAIGRAVAPVIISYYLGAQPGAPVRHQLRAHVDDQPAHHVDPHVHA